MRKRYVVFADGDIDSDGTMTRVTAQPGPA